VNIILFGPPGAGKGTQADKIAKLFKLHKISTGDLLRKEIHNNTDLGKETKILVDKGSLVSDNIINSLIIKVLSDENVKNSLIFDGYPRNINQAKSFELLLKKYNQKISFVFNLNVNKEIIIKRILGRQTCSKCGLIFNEYFKPSTNVNHKCGSEFLVKRSDDNEGVITNRFKTYLDKTLPIINFYKERNLLHDINGAAEIHQIFEEIRTIIASLEG